MKFILGTKQHMTNFFTEDGKAVPVTLISAGPIVVTQVKDTDSDGYSAVQVGYGTQKPERKTKAEVGHTKELGSFRYLREWRVDNSTLKRGDSITLDQFVVGDVVSVSGVTKGKGFQGVVKRHGFHGDKRSHGRKHGERSPGSIGGGGRAGGRVIKGMRMAGRMGSDFITIENLTVVAIDPQSNTLLIKGAIPGRRGTLVEVTSK